MENLNKSCFMCGAVDSDGIILNGEKICRACEEKIVKANVNDSDYDVYKDAVKIILFNEHAKR
ncbi:MULTISPECIES: sigma factor G inhibitor Gin [unclassified Clostridium]|uniref:sigma factor G inhibitor Gin n=1 Tax=unclassified Clostridium TaxID=2614128 RepID=UPI0002981ED8|nr:MULTISPECIES: sigma factor G inhibitor Gin [unclassified Clostridium]EKQ52107.1 MAG: Inhibitor of sigma-G Gin [Clostridium sp. Maddingley MBC34-26]